MYHQVEGETSVWKSRIGPKQEKHQIGTYNPDTIYEPIPSRI